VTPPTTRGRIAGVLAALTLAAAAYLVVLMGQYVFPPHLPRRRLESVYFVMAALGLAAAFARDRPRRREPSGAWRWTWRGWTACTLACTAAAFAVYAPALSVGFLSDDFIVADWARRGQWIYGTDTAFARPVVPLVWAGLAALSADFDRLAHAANIALHGVNAALVVLVGARMGLPKPQAVAAGAVFALTPALTEAVVWATGVHDVLMATFCLAAVAAATFAERGRGWAAATIGAAVLALGVKETAVIVPILAALILWAGGGPLVRRRTGWTLAALAAVSLVYAGVRLALGVPARYGEDIARVYFIKQLVVGPFASLGAPWTVAWSDAHRAASIVRMAALAVIAGVSLAAWRRGERSFRQAAAAAAWVLAAILPVFSLFYVGPSLEGSRYLYLSAAGFSWLVAIAAGRVAAAWGRPAWTTAIVVGLLAVATVPVVPALRYEIARWTEAARLRDAILLSVRGHPSIGRCGSFVAEGTADHLDGAFVFHNGLAQALNADGDGPRCRVAWTGTALTVRPD
jgi:hypothetical protein